MKLIVILELTFYDIRSYFLKLRLLLYLKSETIFTKTIISTI
jgi:hypothetical protein